MIDVTEHIGLACYLANKMYSRYKHKYDLEELVQVAYVGLVKAGNNFDENKGFKFTTYAVVTIIGELKRFVQDDRKFNIRRGVSHKFMMESYEAERETGSLEQRIGVDSFEDKFVETIELNDAIRTLSNKEQMILKSYYIDEMSQNDIGKIYGVTQTRISKINKNIIKKLRIALNISVTEKVSL